MKLLFYVLKFVEHVFGWLLWRLIYVEALSLHCWSREICASNKCCKYTHRWKLLWQCNLRHKLMPRTRRTGWKRRRSKLVKCPNWFQLEWKMWQRDYSKKNFLVLKILEKRIKEYSLLHKKQTYIVELFQIVLQTNIWNKLCLFHIRKTNF